MVPQTDAEIAKALDHAAAALGERLTADRASASRDEDALRGREGMAALDAVRQATDALREALRDRAALDRRRTR